MSAVEMWDYLETVFADYKGPPLDIKSQRVIIEDGDFRQEIHEADDSSEEVISYSTTPIFYVTLQFPVRTESQIGTIFDYYFNTSKGYGQARSFVWNHPTDGHQYVVKFRDKLSRSLSQGGYSLPVIFGIPSLRLKIIGKYAPYNVNAGDVSSSTSVTAPTIDVIHPIVGDVISSGSIVTAGDVSITP